MLDKICSFFSNEFLDKTKEAPLTDHQKQLATAALLVEVATIDHDRDEREQTALLEILKSKFALSESELLNLQQLAELECQEATSLYQFTRLVNLHFNHQDKYALIQAMWSVAYADTRIDKYEDHLIRKVAELIHVSHSDFIKAKHTSRDQQ